VQVILCYLSTVRAIPERLTDASCGGTIQINYIYLLMPIHMESQPQQWPHSTITF